MAYVHCVSAHIVEMTHGMDNVVEGVLDIDGATTGFRTRGHIVKAVNRLYRGSSWKPSKGASVLLDGEMAADLLLVDHIEPARVAADAPIASSPHLDTIATMIPGHPPATKTLRVWRGVGSTRVRFADMVSRIDARGRLVEEILHAALHPDGWRLALIARQGAMPCDTRIDVPVLTILARAAGCPLLVGETAAEADRRRQDELRQDAGARREDDRLRKADPPPFDDCPF